MIAPLWISIGHATEAQAGNFKARAAELYIVHRATPLTFILDLSHPCFERFHLESSLSLWAAPLSNVSPKERFYGCDTRWPSSKPEVRRLLLRRRKGRLRVKQRNLYARQERPVFGS